MPTILILSLSVSAMLLAISALVPSREPTNWPMALLAYLFWPLALAMVVVEVRRSGRDA